MNGDLKKIKKKYGEGMAKFCRSEFSTILETEGLLFDLLMKHFDPSHELYNDITSNFLENEFKDYIFNLLENKDDDKKNEDVNLKTCEELMSEAGYDLYHCKNEKEIQSFKKYYAKGEELCTFNGGRLNHCHVFFAVKKDVDSIKRRKFIKPRREDLYGTSVISIQFSRDSSHTLSIKNRYNHAVLNPDATFSNDLDNIIPGLTKAFESEYGLVQKHNNKGFEIPGYVCANDGKFYKYNREINNIYYCLNNILIDNGEVKRLEKEKYILLDYFLLDLRNGNMWIYDEILKDTESFQDTIKDIEKVEAKNQGKEKVVSLISSGKDTIEITLNKQNRIIGVKDNNIEEIPDYYLSRITHLEDLELGNAKRIGKSFLYWNENFRNINLSNVEEVGDYFCLHNIRFNKLEMPKVKRMGKSTLYATRVFNEFIALELLEIGDYSFRGVKCCGEIKAPKLKKIGEDFIAFCENNPTFSFPELEYVGDGFLEYSRPKEIYAPKIGYGNNVKVKRMS